MNELWTSGLLVAAAVAGIIVTSGALMRLRAEVMVMESRTFKLVAQYGQ